MNKILEKYSVPFAIIIAGLFVAGAVLIGKFYNPKSQLADVSKGVYGDTEEDTPYLNALPVTDADHIFGNKDAEIKVVTYADMECPYCISFESTMRSVVEQYDGKVAWVYRHFPLDFHVNAMPAAVAAECVSDSKGEESFWQFMSKFAFQSEASSGDEKIDVKAIALSLGVDANAFDTCYSSNKFANKITDDANNGFEAGLEGTPYSVVFADNKPVGTIDGAYPLEDVKATIDSYL
ncbi:MAG: thioredoxin domain-containing protein [Parcubacteria group bacterium]